MIINVCVDIPAASVDQLYSYKVPDKYQALIKVGMRVIVPFGPRKLMGIICEIETQSQPDITLKEIISLMDYESFLNEELIELSHYLAEDLQVFRINILSAMLPNMLKVKYESRFYFSKSKSFLDYLKTLNISVDESMDYLMKDTLEAKLSPKEIKELIENHQIKLEYSVLDQQTTKMISQLTSPLSLETYHSTLKSIPDRFHKQKLLLEFIIEHYPIVDLDKSEVVSEGRLTYADIQNALKKGWLTEKKVAVYRDPLENYHLERNKKRNLTQEQAEVYQKINQSVVNHSAETFLLEGVTGSGKTEVYLQLIEDVLKQNQTAILLVPEISLTPQMIRQVQGRFSEGIAVLHSGLSIAEKYDEWRRISRGQVKIVVGARSSIFAPLNNLGLIIIDEEHETTYKQSENPKYHARDVAIWRSQYHHCPLVLGSATPSLESKARASKGTYQWVSLPHRVNQKPLPTVEIVDMTQQEMKFRQLEISQQLLFKIKETIAKKQQIILLLNRRGYSSYLLCRDCGNVLQCPNCDISLTYHKFEHRLKCHYCDYYESVPSRCPKCDSQYLRQHGIGTQKITETLNELFPEAKVLRMDVDTTKQKGAHQKILDEFKEGKADILVGTQMIAKGLDFENVTLVGVINADTSLYLSDFRASERTFQLLTQVSGRAGRGKLTGQVIIQTYNPDHYAIQLAQKHDYQKFFLYEMNYRHIANYPPYYFMTSIVVTGSNESNVSETIYKVKQTLLDLQKQHSVEWMILGPNVRGIGRINNKYYYQIILKYKDRTKVKKIISEMLSLYQSLAPKGVFINIEHEPQYNI